MKRQLIGGAVFLFCLALGPGQAQAVPFFQLVIPEASGGFYDTSTESWTTQETSFELWAVVRSGDLTSTDERVQSVRIAAAFVSGGDVGIASFTEIINETLQTPFSLTSPSLTGPTASQPVPASYFGKYTENLGGTKPVLSDGRAWPNHGAWNTDPAWNEYYLREFLFEDVVANSIQDFGPDGDGTTTAGEIRKFQVEISGTPNSDSQIHFDLYDGIVEKKNFAKFAPFSHDAEFVPEPSSVVIWLLVGAPLAIFSWRRRRMAG